MGLHGPRLRREGVSKVQHVAHLFSSQGAAATGSAGDDGPAISTTQDGPVTTLYKQRCASSTIAQSMLLYPESGLRNLI
jgi:hypothetical protein